VLVSSFKGVDFSFAGDDVKLGAQQAPVKPNSTLQALNDAFHSVSKTMTPSVVFVQVEADAENDQENDQGQFFHKFFGPDFKFDMPKRGPEIGTGSGFIINDKGYILTNNHVVANAKKNGIKVQLSDTREYKAKLIGTDKYTDIAVIKIDAENLQVAAIGNSDEVEVGHIVFAIGAPLGLKSTMTQGIVSALGRNIGIIGDAYGIENFIQTDAAVNPGNSGGPLVDINGELMGINTFIFSQSGGNEGLGFAIPSAVVGFAYPQLRLYGHLHRGVIGIHVQTVTPGLAAGLALSRDWGVVIGDVVPGSPEADAGLRIQDIILAVNGRPIDNLPFFFLSFFMVNPGERVNIEVLRGTVRLGFEVKVVEQQKDADRLFDMTDPETNQIRRLGILGLTVDAKVLHLLPGLRQESGIAVVAKTIIPGAVENSLTTGDIIHALNGVSLNTLESLNTGLDRLKPGSYGVLHVEREGRLIYMTFQIE
jgi:serine protease Do